jgi:hypothetical protein
MVFVHEMGHVFGGLLVGDKFNWVRIGPIEIKRSGKVRGTWNWGTLFTGMTNTLPVSSAGLRWKLFVSILAGPAANIISGALVFLIVPQDGSMIAALRDMFIAGSAFVAFVNLVPAQRRGMMNDGMRLWVLLFSRRRRERLISLRRFAADAKKSCLRTLDNYSFERIASVNDTSDDQVFANYAAYKLDADHEVAAQYLETCLANCSATTPEFREELILEAAKYQALRRKRFDLAREWLSVDKSGKARLNRYFAEALILRSEERLEETIAKVEEALRYIDTAPPGPVRTRQQQAFEKWRQELFNQRAEESAELDGSGRATGRT